MQKIPLIEGKNSPVFIPRERVQDIDNELDWDYAEKKGLYWRLNPDNQPRMPSILAQLLLLLKQIFFFVVFLILG